MGTCQILESQSRELVTQKRVSASWLPPADAKTAFKPMSGQDCHLVVESGISASWKWG